MCLCDIFLFETSFNTHTSTHVARPSCFCYCIGTQSSNNKAQEPRAFGKQDHIHARNCVVLVRDLFLFDASSNTHTHFAHAYCFMFLSLGKQDRRRRLNRVTLVVYLRDLILFYTSFITKTQSAHPFHKLLLSFVGTQSFNNKAHEPGCCGVTTSQTPAVDPCCSWCVCVCV